jgi:hypothetical protein
MVNAWNAIKDTALWWNPIVAGFIGAFGVHLLTQSREREKWILDNKKQEYRELLDALSDSYMSTASTRPGFSKEDNHTRFNSIAMKQNNSLRIFSDRIFITKDLPLPDLERSWRNATSKYNDADPRLEKTREDFDKEYERIKDTIVAAAHRAVPKTPIQRLQFWKD